MKFNGKELKEITSNNWDGKSRYLIVWDEYDDGSYSVPHYAFVIGFDGNKVVVKDNYFDKHYTCYSNCGTGKKYEV